MNKIVKVKCPQCSHVFSYYESEFRPFCSEKCKMIDLGHWFQETYRVPGKETHLPDQLNNQPEDEENEAENYEQAYDEDENESDYE